MLTLLMKSIPEALLTEFMEGTATSFKTDTLRVPGIDNQKGQFPN